MGSVAMSAKYLFKALMSTDSPLIFRVLLVWPGLRASFTNFHNCLDEVGDTLDSSDLRYSFISLPILLVNLLASRVLPSRIFWFLLRSNSRVRGVMYEGVKGLTVML